MNTYLESYRIAWLRAVGDSHPLHAPGPGGRRGKEQPAECAYLPSPEQWRWAWLQGDFWNLGVFPGLEHACIDTDSAGATENVTAALHEHHIPYVPEATPTDGHRHFWLHVDRVPSGLAAQCKLAPELGKGELLTGLANVAVACSIGANGKRYRVLAPAGPEAIRDLPAVSFDRLRWAVASSGSLYTPLTESPVRLLKRDWPISATELLARLHAAAPGAPVQRMIGRAVVTYATRSEAEAAAVAILVLAGRSYPDVLWQFESHKPGHYAERGRGREKYLLRTWANVLGHLAASETRQEIADAYHAIESIPWPGRGGLLDRAVLLGLLAECWRCDRWHVYASVRDLAEYAGAGVHGVHNALQRLRDAGLIRRLGTTAEEACTWDLWPASNGNKGHRGSGGENPASASEVCEAAAARTRGATMPPKLAPVHELWSAAHLGRSAGAVYEHLNATPQWAGALAAATGKGERTVNRALKRLQAVGLAERLDAGWIRGKANLDDVAVTHGASLTASERHGHHERERLAYQDLRERRRRRKSDRTQPELRPAAEKLQSELQV